MKRIKYFILIILIATTSFAQNYNDALRLSFPSYLTGTRSLGMGNATTSFYTGYSSVLINPALIGKANSVEYSGGLNFNNFSNSTKFLGSSTENSKTTTAINEVGFIFPLPTARGSMVVGFGYSRFNDFNYTSAFRGYNPNSSYINYLTEGNDDIAFLLGLSYPLYDPSDNYIKDTTRINGRLTQEGVIDKKGDLSAWSLAGAIEIAPNLFGGATFNYISGEFERSFDYYEDDFSDAYPAGFLLDPADGRTDDFQSFYLKNILNWDMSGWDLRLGLLYETRQNFRVGFQVKLPTYYYIQEQFFVDAESQFGNGTVFNLDNPTRSKIEYDIRTPFEISGGLSYTFKLFTLSGDVKFIDYTQTEFTSGFNPFEQSDLNSEMDQLFTSVLNFNFGGEFYVPMLNTTFRAGFMMMPSAYKNDPSEFDKKFITLGAGINATGPFTLELAYSYGWWKDFGDAYGSNNARYFDDIGINNFMISGRYRF